MPMNDRRVGAKKIVLNLTEVKLWRKHLKIYNFNYSVVLEK